MKFTEQIKHRNEDGAASLDKVFFFFRAFVGNTKTLASVIKQYVFVEANNIADYLESEKFI